MKATESTAQSWHQHMHNHHQRRWPQLAPPLVGCGRGKAFRPGVLPAPFFPGATNGRDCGRRKPHPHPKPHAPVRSRMRMHADARNNPGGPDCSSYKRTSECTSLLLLLAGAFQDCGPAFCFFFGFPFCGLQNKWGQPWKHSLARMKWLQLEPACKSQSQAQPIATCHILCAAVLPHTMLLPASLEAHFLGGMAAAPLESSTHHIRQEGLRRTPAIFLV